MSPMSRFHDVVRLVNLQVCIRLEIPFKGALETPPVISLMGNATSIQGNVCALLISQEVIVKVSLISLTCLVLFTIQFLKHVLDTGHL